MANFYGGVCPSCGLPLGFPLQQQQMGFGYNPMMANQYAFGPNYGMGPLPGTYSYSAGGLGGASDDEIRDMVLTSLDSDSRVPFDSDIDVDVTGGIVTLTGTVPNKRIKHAAGDDAWWIPDVVDLNNELRVVGRRQEMRRSRGQRE